MRKRGEEKDWGVTVFLKGEQEKKGVSSHLSMTLQGDELSAREAMKTPLSRVTIYCGEKGKARRGKKRGGGLGGCEIWVE